LQRLAEDGETVTPSLPEPGVWTGMASANALAPLRWKRAKIHHGSRRRRSLTPHQEAGNTSAVVTLGPAFAKPVAIGRGPYTSRHDSATSAAQPCRCSFQASAPKLRTVGLTANRPKIVSLPPRVVQNGSQLYLLMSWIGG
jgi:hypothetical protein